MPRDLEPEPNALGDALDAYRRAFGREAMPSLWGFELANPRVAELVMHAVNRGRPFRHGYTLSRLCGGCGSTPPPDMLL